MDKSPDQLMDEVEASRLCLNDLGRNYATERRTLAKAQLAYEKAMGHQYLSMIHDAQSKGTRVPAEDMRKAIAHSKINQELYEKYLLALADVEGTDRIIRCEQSNLSGLQTELSQLRVEYTHA